MKVKTFLLYTMIYISNFFIKGQNINNLLNINYSNCLQDKCQKQIDGLQLEYMKALNFKNDNIQYNKCMNSELSCKYQFYLPFSQVNNGLCDKVCQDAQIFTTDEFKTYIYCSNQCFDQSISMFKQQELNKLQQFGDCMIKQNGFLGFPLLSTNDMMIKDVDSYQNCILSQIQCKSYLQEYTIQSFSDCFDICQFKIFETPRFQMHIKATKACILEIQGSSDEEDNGVIEISWYFVVISIIVIASIIGCIFMIYRSFKQKLEIQNKSEEQMKNDIEQNTHKGDKIQERQQNLYMKDEINQDSQIPAFMSNNEKQCSINNNKYLNISANNQETNVTQIYNHQLELSYIKHANAREEDQMANSQPLKAKIDNIFCEIEQEKEKRQAMAEKKIQKTQKQIKQLEQQQQKQMQIDQFGQLKILEQLKKNFDEISNSFNQSFGIDKANINEQENDENLKQQQVVEKESQIIVENNIPSTNQYDGYEKIFSNLESNFEKNISGILQNVELESLQDETDDKNQKDQIKNFQQDNEVNKEQTKQYQTIIAK